ncbi:hypothetical protein KDW_54260 [Dictyobacter vulcani]|uniref:Uncharacterized protein n=1 Tax=Dictyobacter vulcani TaxID=2607529 RepID=A0A5J4KPF1_9CHLR|nr:hypothetical protein KDW_54260 [Dictyobacter vulcani]
MIAIATCLVDRIGPGAINGIARRQITPAILFQDDRFAGGMSIMNMILDPLDRPGSILAPIIGIEVDLYSMNFH